MNSDFSELHSRDINGLHLLAILLTADQSMADKCFVSGLQGCENENPIFKDWAHSWARHAIMKNGIHLVAPHRGLAQRISVQMALDDEFYATPEQASAAAKVLGLGDFDRIAFIISVVEGYSDQECALFLHCSPHDVHQARTRAQHQTAEAEASDAVLENEATLQLHRHSLQAVLS